MKLLKNLLKFSPISSLRCFGQWKSEYSISINIKQIDLVDRVKPKTNVTTNFCEGVTDPDASSAAIASK